MKMLLLLLFLTLTSCRSHNLEGWLHEREGGALNPFP